MSLLLKLNCRLNRILIKIPDVYLAEGEFNKLSLRFTWTCKGLRRVKTILKKNKVGGLSLSDNRVCYKANYNVVLAQG
jgi:hypothetical protein